MLNTNYKNVPLKDMNQFYARPHVLILLEGCAYQLYFVTFRILSDTESDMIPDGIKK